VEKGKLNETRPEKEITRRAWDFQLEQGIGKRGRRGARGGWQRKDQKTEGKAGRCLSAGICRNRAEQRWDKTPAGNPRTKWSGSGRRKTVERGWEDPEMRKETLRTKKK